MTGCRRVRDTHRMRTATLAVSAALLAGCGDQPHATAQTQPAPTATPTATVTPTPALTHREFVRALNASCVKDKRKLNRQKARFEAAMDSGDNETAARIYAAQLRLLRQHTRRAARLEPPPEDRDAFKDYMRSQRRIEGLAKRIVRALREDDQGDLARYAWLLEEDRADRLTAALDLGADKCGS